MHWMDSNRKVEEGVTDGSCMINRVQGLQHAEQGLQHALDRFSAACDQAGMKNSTKMTEVLCLTRNPSQCTLQVSGITLQQVEKLKYLGVVFTSNRRWNKEINTYGSVKLTQFCVSFIALWSQNFKPTKLSVFKSVFFSDSNLWFWILGDVWKTAIPSTNGKDGILPRVHGVTLHDKVRRCEIHKTLDVEPLHLRIERSQLRWFGHVSRMTQ